MQPLLRNFVFSLLLGSAAIGTKHGSDPTNGLTCTVQVFDQSGKVLAQWADVMVPWGLWVTARDEIWVCGSSPMPRPKKGYRGLPPKDQVVLKFARSGKVLARCTIPKGRDGKEQPGEVNWLHAVAVDSKGAMYLGDIQGRRAQRFTRQD